MQTASMPEDSQLLYDLANRRRYTPCMPDFLAPGFLCQLEGNCWHLLFLPCRLLPWGQVPCPTGLPCPTWECYLAGEVEVDFLWGERVVALQLPIRQVPAAKRKQAEPRVEGPAQGRYSYPARAHGTTTTKRVVRQLHIESWR